MVPEIVWRTDWWMNGEVTYRDGCPALLFIKNIWIYNSNALYSESLQSISIRMFDTFDNWDHYFESNLSLELLIKVFLYKKALFLSLPKKKKELCHMKLFLCSYGISLGRYCQKILTKSRGFGKNIKRRNGHIMGGEVGGVYRRGIKISAHYALKCFKTKLCD